MADTSDDILRTYLATVLRLQREREEQTWSDADLQQAALDAGMTDTDLALVRQHIADSMNRGLGFIRYQNWDDALDELERARGLAPNSVDVLNALATAYAGRWRRDGTGSDRDLAMRRAERVLQLDSRNDDALRMISALRTNRSELLGESIPAAPAPGGRKMIIIVTALLVMGLVVVLMLVSSGGRKHTPPPSIPAPPAPPTPPPHEPAPRSQAPAAKDAATAG